MDYSSQQLGQRRGKHAYTVDTSLFEKFVIALRNSDADADMMLEIKDKEKSALKALNVLRNISMSHSKLSLYDNCEQVQG